MSEDQQMLFNNPLYLLRTSFDLDSLVKSAKTALSSSARVEGEGKTHLRLRENDYSMQLTRPQSMLYLSSNDWSAVKPELGLVFIKLWSQYYLRWAVPLQIVGGGNPSQYLQQCILAEEVICLEHKLTHLTHRLNSRVHGVDVDDNGGYSDGSDDSNDQTLSVLRSNAEGGRGAERPHSGLLFGVNGYRSSSTAMSSVYITSSFPFSPWTSENQRSLVTGSLSRYLKDTAIDHDYDPNMTD